MTDIPQPPEPLTAPPKYQIFPAIGVARVGNSRLHSYVAASAPQIDHVPEGGYRGPDPTGETLEPLFEGGPPRPVFEDRIKRMGCLFRIFQFDPLGRAVAEIDARNAEVEWMVQLVNKKAAGPADWGYGNRPGNLNPGGDLSRYILDTGQHVIAGEQAAPVDLFATMMQNEPGETTVQLGTIDTDVVGRLRVYGGFGETGSWLQQAPDPVDMRNPGWWDDTCDGKITARVTIDGETHDALSARIVVAPPDYAHPCLAPVTLYDLAIDRLGRMPEVSSFSRDIHPILHRAAWLEWTLYAIEATRWGRSPKHGHGYSGNHEMHPDGGFLNPAVFNTLIDPDNAEGDRRRGRYLSYLKDPSGTTPPGGPGEFFSMPAIAELTFTPTQYAHFARFSAKGSTFEFDWEHGRDPCDLGQTYLNAIPLEDKPTAVNRAAMDFAVGGPFLPGVEIGAIAGDAATYEPIGNIAPGADIHVPDDLGVGDLTATLALPWQCGMNQHNFRTPRGTPDEDNLWPSARPVLVPGKFSGSNDEKRWTRPLSNLESGNIFEQQKMDGNLQMIENWHRLGFLVPVKGYVETDRTMPDGGASMEM